MMLIAERLDDLERRIVLLETNERARVFKRIEKWVARFNQAINGAPTPDWKEINRCLEDMKTFVEVGVI